MNNLINLIKRFDISEKQLAKDLGVSISTVSLLIKGKIHLKDTIILKICNKYKVSADWLLGIENSKQHRCYYIKRKSNWVSGCGYRVNYNKYWAYCPHCGKQIANLNRGD